MLADLQVHTVAGSPDSVIDPAELPAACLSVGLDAVATTEHRSYDLELMSRVFDGSGVLWIPAREVAWDGRHILVLSSNLQKIDQMPIAFSYDELPSEDEECALIWAHPAAIGGSSAYGPQRPALCGPSQLQGVEVLNGRHLHFSAAVDIALDISQRLELAATGGSDAHDVESVGRCATEIEVASTDPAEVIRVIRQGRTRPVLNSAWANKHGYDYRESLMRFVG